MNVRVDFPNFKFEESSERHNGWYIRRVTTSNSSDKIAASKCQNFFDINTPIVYVDVTSPSQYNEATTLVKARIDEIEGEGFDNFVKRYNDL